MARPPEPQVNITEGIQPAAQILNTYVRPEEPAPSPLHAVAQALAPLSADLFALSKQQAAKQNKEDIARGEAEFWNQNESGAADAVAGGLIPADKSPKFMEGYAKMAGLSDASRLKQEIGPDYAKLDKTTSDPAAFDKWFFPYVRSKANPDLVNNPAYARQWAVGIAALHGELTSKYVQDRSEAVTAGAYQTFTGSIGNTMDDHYYTQGGAPDTVKLGDSLNTIRELATRSGLEKAKVDKGLVDTVTTKALELKNPALLDVLGTIPADPADPTGTKLGETEYGNATKLKTAHSIQTLLVQDQERARKEDDRKDKLAANSTMSSVLTQWSKDTNYVPSEAEIATISKVHPEWRATMATLRTHILNNDTVEDPKAATTLYEDILKSGDPYGKIEAAIRGGTLKTAKSIDEAMKYGTLVENYNKSGGVAKITEDASFKSMEQAIITHTKDPKWAGSMFAEQGLTEAGRAALFDARTQAMQWSVAHPLATPQERTAFLFSLQEGIVKRIKAPIDLGNEFKPSYTPAPGAPSAAAAVPAAPGAPPPPAPVAPQPAPAAPAPAAPPAPQPQKQGAILPQQQQEQQQLKTALSALPASPKFETLQSLGASPALVNQITSAAQRMKIEPQQLLDRMWEAAKVVPGKQGDATTTGDTATVQPVRLVLPGGGAVELHGVRPEVAQQLTDMVQRVSGTLHAGLSSVLGATGNVDPKRVAQIDASPMRGAIEQVAQETGFPVATLKALVSVESGGRTTDPSKTYKGPLQLSNQEFAQYGTGDINNVGDNLRAGVKSIQAKSEAFKAEFGKDPTLTELYLMHQQGPAGLRAHEANPDAPAWQNMASTGEGKAKGPHWAKMAVWGNVPADMRGLFGNNVNNVTSAEFMALWRHKLEGVPYDKALAELRGDRSA